jgi:uncharacterized protein (DUF1810 family)
LKRIVGDSASESNDPYDLNRFISAQQGVYDRALAELREGLKRSHWMWYIFPTTWQLPYRPQKTGCYMATCKVLLSGRVVMQSRMLMSRVQNNMRQGPEHALPEMS